MAAIVRLQTGPIVPLAEPGAVVEHQPGADDMRHDEAAHQRQHDLAEQALRQQPHECFSASAASM